MSSVTTTALVAPVRAAERTTPPAAAAMHPSPGVEAEPRPSSFAALLTAECAGPEADVIHAANETDVPAEDSTMPVMLGTNENNPEAPAELECVAPRVEVPESEGLAGDDAWFAETSTTHDGRIVGSNAMPPPPGWTPPSADEHVVVEPRRLDSRTVAVVVIDVSGAALAQPLSSTPAPTPMAATSTAALKVSAATAAHAGIVDQRPGGKVRSRGAEPAVSVDPRPRPSAAPSESRAAAGPASPEAPRRITLQPEQQAVLGDACRVLSQTLSASTRAEVASPLRSLEPSSALAQLIDPAPIRPIEGRVELRLAVPQVGDVDVRVEVNEGRVTLEVRASEGASLAGLESRLSHLPSALARVGLSLGEVQLAESPNNPAGHTSGGSNGNRTDHHQEPQGSQERGKSAQPPPSPEGARRSKRIGVDVVA